jgi:3-hydroxyisobutyrate dehydrogenase
MDTSTVDVETSRWCHAEAEERGLTFVDAPISGGPPAPRPHADVHARRGAADVERAREVGADGGQRHRLR